MSLKEINYIFTLLFIMIATSCISQSAAVLKGTSQFRYVFLDHYLINLQQIEKLRVKLDEEGVTEKEFERFCFNLNYISDNLYSGKLVRRQYMVNALKFNPAYRSLNKKELAIFIDNLELLFLNKLGIWEERYPHKLNNASLRLKEISQYGVKSGDRVLHFQGLNNHLSEILHLSYDSIEVVYNPFKFEFRENKVFDIISTKIIKPSNSLSYLLDEFPKPINNKLYDKVVFECLGLLFFRVNPNFKKKMKTIYNLLEPEGELIVGTNYNTIMFDGPVPEISEIDKKIEKILDCGFELKERLASKNEYVVYKFVKVNK